jgi:hypothetical protein
MNLNDLFEGTGLSPETLASYKEKAGAEATAADKAGDFKKGNKRFSGIVKATKKQFANDEKGIKESVDNLNDDDWYEISADTKSIVGTLNQRPQGAVMGRPVKLPNGNYAIKGMQAKHMGLTRGVAEGSGLNANESWAQKVFDDNPNIETEDEILNHAYAVIKAEVGNKTARYLLNYDEDFPSDLVSSYRWMQKNKQGVAEGNFDDANRDIANIQMHKLTKTHTSDCGYRYGHDCDCGGTVTHASDCGYKYGHDCDCGLAKSKGVAEGLSKRDQKDVAAIKSAIERLQAQLKQPNVDKSDIQARIAHETKRLALYKQGVAEGVAETLPLNDAVKVLRQYGADYFKTTSNELHFYKNGKPFSVDLVMNPDATRSASLSSLNSATRGLKGQGVAEATVTKKSQPYNDPNWAKKLPNEKLDAIAGPRYKKDKKEQGVTEGQSDLDAIKRFLAK